MCSFSSQLFPKLHSMCVAGCWCFIDDVCVDSQSNVLNYYLWCLSCYGAVSQSICISVQICHVLVFFIKADVSFSSLCVSQWGQDDHSDRPGVWFGAECNHAGGGNWANSEYLAMLFIFQPYHQTHRDLRSSETKWKISVFTVSGSHMVTYKTQIHTW